MFSNWKICFNVINMQSYDESLCKFGKPNDFVRYTTWTNFSIWCQQTTKTTLKCKTDSFGPVCQLWSVTLKCMREPQRCIQQHKSLKVTRNATNRDKHLMKHRNKFLPTIFSDYYVNTRKVCIPIRRLVSMSSIYVLLITFLHRWAS